MWHVKNSVLAVFLVFLFFFFHCFLSNVFGLLFPVLAAFVVDFDFFSFFERKIVLENSVILAKHRPVCGLQLHRPLFLLQKAKEGKSPSRGVFCAYFICVRVEDPLT